ncbi:unnamed protein product [Mucor hiemalis]
MKLIHIARITQAAIDQTIKDVVALKESIPQIITASAGKNFTDRGKGYEYAWVVELAKKEDLPIYANSDSHQEFVNKYKSTFEDLLAIDYEV